MRRKNAEATVPVMANRAPWNELVLQGQRKVKTLSFNWKHRGPILLYTSSNRVDAMGWEFYGLKKSLADVPKGAIVGIANVVNVLAIDDLPASYFDDDPNLFETTGQAFVAVVDGVKRFKKPIPFKPPQGAIRVFRAPAKYMKRVTV